MRLQLNFMAIKGETEAPLWLRKLQRSCLAHRVRCPLLHIYRSPGHHHIVRNKHRAMWLSFCESVETRFHCVGHIDIRRLGCGGQGPQGPLAPSTSIPPWPNSYRRPARMKNLVRKCFSLAALRIGCELAGHRALEPRAHQPRTPAGTTIPSNPPAATPPTANQQQCIS